MLFTLRSLICSMGMDTTRVLLFWETRKKDGDSETLMVSTLPAQFDQNPANLLSVFLTILSFTEPSGMIM